LEYKQKTGIPRHHAPATKEWRDSVYTYNKNGSKTIPSAYNRVNSLINSYFNLSPLYENKRSKRVDVLVKRLSLNRILVSKPEMKHTNNKVIITVYLYNKNKKFFLHNLNEISESIIFKPKTPTKKVYVNPQKKNTLPKQK